MPKCLAEVLLEEALRRLQVNDRPPSKTALQHLSKLLSYTIKLQKQPEHRDSLVQVKEHAGALAAYSRSFKWREWATNVASQTEGDYNRGHVLREINRLADSQR